MKGGWKDERKMEAERMEGGGWKNGEGRGVKWRLEGWGGEGEGWKKRSE